MTLLPEIDPRQEAAWESLLERCLADLEQQLDEATELDLLRQWQQFWEGHCPTSLFRPKRQLFRPGTVTWPKIPINQAMASPPAMLLTQYSGCAAALAEGNGAVHCVRANYGTPIMPMQFGATLFLMDEVYETLPASEPLGPDRIRALLDRGVPSRAQPYAERVFATGRRFAEIARRYPKIGRFVNIYHPDLQGPMDICEMLWGSTLFVDLYDQPDLVKQALDLICDTYVDYLRAWDAIVPRSPALPTGYAAHWGMLHRGHIFLRDDSAMNLSPEMAAEFIRPYDQRLLDAFGGGAIHACGRVDHYLEVLAGMPGYFAFNLSQPHLNNMEHVYQTTVDRGIVILNLAGKAAEAALAAGRDLHGRVHVI